MSPGAPRFVSVGVLVTLHRSDDAGGHVKCWERFAEAAVEVPDLDLTVYFLGDEGTEHPLGPSTRFITLRPRLGTDRFSFLRQDAGHTDLAPYHPALARMLPRHDVLHVTDTFAFGRTARRVARRTGAPLVFSLHTHLPRFTRVYAREIFQRALGRGLPSWLGLDRLALDRVRIHDRVAHVTERAIEDVMRASRAVLVSNERDRAWAARVVPPERVRSLRRGVDRERFHPRRRRLADLRTRYGVPDRLLVLFVGRVDDSKGVMLVAGAVRRLREQGVPAHLVLVGAGERAGDIRGTLGADVTCLGRIPQEALADVFAAADVFAFPSETETFGNVVIEALASGLPAVVTAGTSCAERVADHGRVGQVEAGAVVADATVEAWTAALRPLLEDVGRREAAGAAARRRVELGWPTWGDVLNEDLLPVWRESGN